MKEIKLSRPIKINGVETDVLKIVKEELLVEDMLRISKATSDPMEQDVHMLAYITFQFLIGKVKTFEMPASFARSVIGFNSS